ncbi:MAG: hypothetical protein ACFFE6_00280 [Candidatus Thorarchaeota archaeon]
MNLDSARLFESKDEETHIVRGCPCYKEFGSTEKVCLNCDDVLPIRAISVDPSFFSSLDSRSNLKEFASDNETMCYLVIFLDRVEGFCYCVSQNQRIRINNQDVKVSEIDSALQFVTSTEKDRDGVLCSECLYRYLRTLGESSEGFLSNEERNDIIVSYVRDIADKIAKQLSSFEEGENDNALEFREHLKDYIRELNRNRSHWTSMIRGLKKENADEDLIQLVELYRTLSRLESIFMFQVQSLDNESEESDPLSVLQFMVSISEKVMRINDEIRDLTNYMVERDSLPENIQEMLMQHTEKRKKTEYRFSNLVSVLQEIDSHTSK